MIIPVTGSFRDDAFRNQVAPLEQEDACFLNCDRSRQWNMKIFEQNNIETNNNVLLCRIVLFAQEYNIFAILLLNPRVQWTNKLHFVTINHSS